MEKKKKAIRLFFIFLAVISFLLAAYLISFPKRIVLDLSKFPLKLISLSFSPIQGIINCHNSLREVSVLRKKNQELKILLAALQEEGRENKRLKELLSFKKSSHLDLVAAKVISFDASNFRRSIVIEKGESSGIRRGNPVITSDGITGMVVEVGNLSSRIILLNDPDFSMAAKIKRTNAMGVISGSLDGLCRLRYLDLDEDIQIGDEIISSEENSRFPGGLDIGKVVNIAKEHSGLVLFAVVKPKVKLSSLEEVFVVVNR